MEAAKGTGVPLDISASPGLFGGLLRGSAQPELLQVSSTDYENAYSAAHAGDLIQAHLLETLSAIGRDHIDFYLLRSRRKLEDKVLNGALESLELARQEGHIRFLGLYVEGQEADSLANWQAHDAFEVICLEGDATELRSLATSRRVGVLERLAGFEFRPPSQVGIAPVTSAEEVRKIIGVLA
jgi:hypothetical protein